MDIKTNLSLEIVRTYGFVERTYNPDYDDTCIDFTLPNGITLTMMTQCLNHNTKCDTLYGFDSYIIIETKEELDSILSKNKEIIIQEIKEKYKTFDIDNN